MNGLLQERWERYLALQPKAIRENPKVVTLLRLTWWAGAAATYEAAVIQIPKTTHSPAEGRAALDLLAYEIHKFAGTELANLYNFNPPGNS